MKYTITTITRTMWRTRVGFAVDIEFPLNVTGAGG
jgi:hypothetical protein